MPGSVEDSIELRSHCAALVIPPHHIAVDRTAAWIHGIDTHAWGEHDSVVPVEFSALRGHRRSERNGIDGHVRDLATRDLMMVRDLRVTTPLRTALDLGCHLRKREAIAALVEFARLHDITPESMARELPRFRGRRGVVQLRSLIQFVDSRLESPRESWTWLELIEAGIPLPEIQFWVEEDGVQLFRLDFAWPRRRVALEYDGRDFHRLTADQIDQDRERRAWLRDHGWTIVVVGLGDFSAPSRERWVAELRQALRPAYTTRRW
ncbi:hypothetical protein BH09ACT11_BH09ACT11_22360 [soil metagenome]